MTTTLFENLSVEELLREEERVYRSWFYHQPSHNAFKAQDRRSKEARRRGATSGRCIVRQLTPAERAQYGL